MRSKRRRGATGAAAWPLRWVPGPAASTAMPYHRRFEQKSQAYPYSVYRATRCCFRFKQKVESALDVAYRGTRCRRRFEPPHCELRLQRLGDGDGARCVP